MADPSPSEIKFARQVGREAAELLHPAVQWEEAKELLGRAWPDKGQRLGWEVMHSAVSSGWADAVATLDRAGQALEPRVECHVPGVVGGSAPP